jgi:serine/threonine protein kinase
MSGTITDTVINIFDNMLGLNSYDGTKNIIDKLSAESGSKNLSIPYGRFTELALNLPTIEVTMFDENKGRVKINSVTDVIKRIGGGSYGTIFLGKSGSVYKRITMQNFANLSKEQRIYYTELFHREFFIEAFIQTVLQCDTTYGNNIARLEGVYKDKLVKETSHLPEAFKKYTYFYKMENIPYTFSGYVNSLASTDVSGKIITKFQDLGVMLEYFMETYGFFHRDLHGGNIMFDTRGNIKLIDFGLSCIKVDSVQYSVKNNDCMSSDLFILITYLLEYNIVPVLNVKFKELLSDKEFDIYNLMKVATPNGEAIFHRCYFEHFIYARRLPWTNDITSKFIERILPKLDPRGFVTFWKDYELSLVPRPMVRVTAPMVRVTAPMVSANKLQNIYTNKLYDEPKFEYANPMYSKNELTGIPVYRTILGRKKGGKTRKIKKLRKKKSRSLA